MPLMPTLSLRPFIPVVLAVMLQICVISANAQTDAGPLEAGFKTPPKGARPSVYWLWLNGYVNRNTLDQELQAYAAHGIGGLCIFDMGARGDKDHQPPTGPAFMDDECMENIALATRLAEKYDLDIQLAACSSWDLGGAWVNPHHASMGLYRSETHVRGPLQYDAALPMPALPAGIPRTVEGQPAFIQDVAVLAVPGAKRQPAYEFIFRLPRDEIHEVDHVVLYNTESDNAKHGKLHLFAKNFSVAVSVGEPRQKDFQEIVRARLEPHTFAQRFDFTKTGARFVRLRIFNGHNPKFDQVQLGEFELYTPQGVNVAGSIEIDPTQDSAEILWFNSELGIGKRWTAANIHDGVKAGPTGSWCAMGLPPLFIKDRSQIINVTDHVDTLGRLTWRVPEGQWTFMRFVCANTGERLKVPSPQSDGLATDHFSSEATRTFIQTLTDRLEKKMGDLRQTPIKQIYLPSYEVKGAKWTPDFLQQFRRYRQYDMTTYLPILAGCQVKSDDTTLRFIYDYRKTQGDLLVDAYYRTASDTARAAGLGIEAEAGGPGPPVHQVPVDALKALGAIDEMRGEFWPWRPECDHLWVVKETACAAHVYGRKRVSMEAFTGFRHWQDGPFDLKPSADRAFCEGMNRVVWHTSSHQPPEAGKPGWVYGAGSHLMPNLVWWPMAKPFLEYLSRCSFLLQQGLFVGDVCYYYGDQGYNFVPPKHVDPSLGFGYDYDVTNAEVLLNRMSVKAGRIVLPDGMQYELLVLPDREDCDLAVLKRIEQLVKAGATVVGPKPVRSNGLTNYPQQDLQVKALADKIWGACDGQTVQTHRYGKGTVIHGQDLRDILTRRGVGPDFQFSSTRSDTQVDYIHRRTDQADIYFVRNKKSQSESVDAIFRVFGKVPELWCPLTGQIDQAPAYKTTAQGTRVSLSLAPSGSVFVVFRNPMSPAHTDSSSKGSQAIETEVRNLPDVMPLVGPWQVDFSEGWGTPNSVVLPELMSWTEHEHTGIQHFSGIARYHISFELTADWLEKDRQITLDLGQLWAVAQIRLNGQDLGVLWAPPYRVNVTSSARIGQNNLEVEVANTWANRLIGDSKTPKDQRFCKTNITTSGTPGRAWKDIPLRESGLLGPVQVIPALKKTASRRYPLQPKALTAQRSQ